MRLCGHVYDHVGAGDQRVDELTVADVTVPELVAIRLPGAVGQIGDAAGISQGVEHENPVLRILVVEVAGKVAPDESRSTGDEDRLRYQGCSPPPARPRIAALSSPQLNNRSTIDRYGTKSRCCWG